MDLLLLAQDVTWGGRAGDAVHLRTLAHHLAVRGHRVRVIARGGSPAPPIGGVDFLPIRSSMNLGLAPIRRPLAVRALLRAAAERRPDLVYSRGFGDWAEAAAARALGVPIVYEVNGDAIAERESRLGRRLSGPARALAIRNARRGFGAAAAVVAVTETLRERLAQDFGVAPGKIRLVPNAADTDLFRPRDAGEARRTVGVAADADVLLFVGNLAPWQGVQELLAAFSEVVRGRPPALLLIVGDGEEGRRLREGASALGLGDRTRFVGAVPQDDVPAYIAAADVCVAPMTKERLRSGSSAIKIHEYLACERVVVASRIPGLEFLENERLGILVPPEDVPALAGALERALADEAWRREAQARSRGFVLGRASWASVAAAVEDTCRRAVAG